MMMPKRYSGVVGLCAAALVLGLTACGAGEVSGSAVTGLALTDGPIQGTVSLNDSSATVQHRTVTTRADGSFSIDVADLTPPYLLQVEWQGATGAGQLFAVSEGNENLDVNPITDVAFDVAAGAVAPAMVFREASRERNHSTATRVRALLSTLSTVLAPLFERYGIADPRTDRSAVRALLEDVRVLKEDGVVTVTNKETGGVIFQGPLSDLASGTFDADAMPAGPGTTPPPATTCASFTYSPWGACRADGTQARTVVTSSPSGCTGGSPVTSQACNYVPPSTTCSAFTYSAWGACQAGNTQTRSVLTSSPSGCSGGSPVTTQACTYVPPSTTCTSFTYSAWGACQASNTQTRTVLTSSPSGCTGGTRVTSQACTYVPPTAIDGAALYSQYCSGCHGNGKKGSSASSIQGAIDANRGGMGSTALRALTPAQVAAISAAP
jgi:hypothetical protein